MSKATAKLGGVTLAATLPVVWRLTTGTAPYQTVLAVHKSQWQQLRDRRGEDLTLEIVDSRGVMTSVRKVNVLHEVASESPNRVNFVVSDLRWRWNYPIVTRDYNVPRKTGVKSVLYPTTPAGPSVEIPSFDYLSYSLKDGKEVWSAKEVLVDVLELLNDALEDGEGGEGFTHFVESFPIEEGGEFSVQNLLLRDRGDIALGKAIGQIPGADIYVNLSGEVVVFDGADLDATEDYRQSLPPSTWDGDKDVLIDKAAIRPKTVEVFYTREVECVFDHEDNYPITGTSAARSLTGSEPYLDNVVSTVDLETTVSEFDPVQGKTVTKTVPPGTWVTFKGWLEAMNEDRPEGSMPWTFDTIRAHWFSGNMDAVLGARGSDLDEEANIALRVQMIKQHFRQTFRINPRYARSVRQLLAVRVAWIDPVSGTRAPATSWGQFCIVPSVKAYMAKRKEFVGPLLPGETNAGLFRNIDSLAPSRSGSRSVVTTPPSPAKVTILDRDLGVFRLDWVASPFGLTQGFVPCHLVDGKGDTRVATRDLSEQDKSPLMAGAKIVEGTNGIFLRKTSELKVLLTLVPNSPNNERQFHREVVGVEDIDPLFRSELRLQEGKGPTLQVYVPPGELTALFAWAEDETARTTVGELLGLDEESEEAGLEGPELPGFLAINVDQQLGDRHLVLHARSVAAEAIAAFADSRQGIVTTRLVDNASENLKIEGNVRGLTVRMERAPSGKVSTVHDFSGQPRPTSRFALLPDSVRTVVLGIVNRDQ